MSHEVWEDLWKNSAGKMPWCETMRQKTSRAMLEQIYGQMQRCTLIGFWYVYIYVHKSTIWFNFLIPFLDKPQSL